MTDKLSETFRQSLREDYARARVLLAEAEKVLALAQQRVDEHKRNCRHFAAKFISESNR